MPRPQPTLKTQARKMVFDIYNYFLKENNKTNAQIKTADATNISISTVKRIIKESKNSENLVVFRTPGKKRQRAKTVLDIDDFTKGIIKRCIHNFHKTENELPTVGKLHAKLCSDINFRGSEKSMRRIIKELGFKWKATENHRKILIESSSIRLLRINYLEKLKKYRQQNRPIIYTDETYVNVTQTTSNGCTDGSTDPLKNSISKGQRVMVVHAGSEAGFVPNALLIFKSGIRTGNYHDDMNFENYEMWIRTQLIPNLPPKSVVVIDNAPYHNKQCKLEPNSNERKAVMEAWLSERGIPFRSEMLKPELYDLIKRTKDRYKKFSIDNILKEYGHEVLRLPPHHPDLNPMAMAWAAIKEYVAQTNVHWNLSLVMNVISDKANMMGPDEWKTFCDNVKKIEDSYTNSDLVIDEITEEFIIKGEDSDTNTSESEVSTDSEDEVAPSTSSHSLYCVKYEVPISFSDECSGNGS